MAVSKLTASDFPKEVLAAGTPVVVDFYADWCGPCRQLAPALEELSSKWEGSIRFVRVDVDESSLLAHRYGVTSIPTIMLFEGGQLAAQTLGARSAQAIERELGLTDVQASPAGETASRHIGGRRTNRRAR